MMNVDEGGESLATLGNGKTRDGMLQGQLPPPAEHGQNIKDAVRTGDPNTVRRPSNMYPERVVINVGGERFVTLATTLRNAHGTRFAALSRNDPSFDPHDDEYFFDRNPRLFPYLLDFCRTGEVHFPHGICGPVIRRELKFWGINDSAIPACCWKTYHEFEEEQETLQLLQQAFYHCEEPSDTSKLPLAAACGGWRSWSSWCHVKQDVWSVLEEPNSSKLAKVWAYTYTALIVLSIAIVCLCTHPKFRAPYRQTEDIYISRDLRLANHSELNLAASDLNRTSTVLPGLGDIHDADERIATCRNQSMINPNHKINMYLKTEPIPAFHIIDHLCTFIFTLELIVRFVVWPGKLNFFKTFFNVVDTLAVLPQFILTVGNLVQPLLWICLNMYTVYVITSVVCTLRAIRILKIVRHNRGLQIMFLALRASIQEILLLILLMLIGMVIFSTMIYFAEFSEPDIFLSIPTGFWWSVVTMTTVGYGDVTPRTWVGYIVASMCAMCGVLVTTLPIPVIANSFTLYHKYARLKKCLDTRINPQIKDTKNKAPPGDHEDYTLSLFSNL